MKPPTCRKCRVMPCYAYSSGNYSVQCYWCNEAQSLKRRRAAAKRRKEARK